MLFDTLAEFCQSGAGIPGVEICKALWTLMERLEVINIRAATNVRFGGGAAFTPVKGVEIELEEIEAVHGLYPATIPFLKLLGTLIHTPKRIPLKDRVRTRVWGIRFLIRLGNHIDPRVLVVLLLLSLTTCFRNFLLGSTCVLVKDGR